MSQVTTTSEILEFFAQLVDEDVSEEEALRLANSSKDVIEGERPWEFLKKLDNSKSVNAGENYDTERDLPTDFLEPLKDGFYVGDDTTPYLMVPFESKYRFKDMSYRFCIDWPNSKFYILGSIGKTGVIYFWHIYQTPALTTDQDPVWPAKYRKLIAYEMAAIYLGGIESDEYNSRLLPTQRHEAQRLQDGMDLWDARLKASGAENLGAGRIGCSDGVIVRD